MQKDNNITESFVKKTIELAVEKLQKEIKSGQNETVEAMGILQNDMQSRIEDMENHLNDSLDNKLDKKMGQLRGDIFEKLDEISGNIKVFEEEHAILSMHSSENYDKLENHEKRITKLENSSLPSVNPT